MGSGWYIANYEQADPLNYGFRQGCDFFSGACSSWKGDGYFCNDTQIPSCNFDRSAKAECIVTEWAIVPSAFQYFNNPPTGGTRPSPISAPSTPRSPTAPAATRPTAQPRPRLQSSLARTQSALSPPSATHPSPTRARA